MLDLSPKVGSIFYLGETKGVIPAFSLLRTFHLIPVSRVSTSNPSYHATILAKLHADGYDVPNATIDAIKHEYTKLNVSEHLALKALSPKYMSE
jgi:hypothetical protein